MLSDRLTILNLKYNTCTLIYCNMAIYMIYETDLLKPLFKASRISTRWWPTNLSDQMCPAQQIVGSVVTIPPACLLSCDLSMHQPFWLPTSLDAQLRPIHQTNCWVMTCPPAWLLSCDLFTGLSEQLLLAHQLGYTVVTCPTTCPLTCHLSTSQPGSVVTYLPAA